MKVAVIHDWLNGMRGGENVLEAILELYPQAEVFTLLHKKSSVSAAIEAHPIHTSPMQTIPFGVSRYRFFLPLMPYFIRQFDLSGFDLIISSSHCVAKGIKKPEGARHIAYLHAPMRYIWDRYEDYFGPKQASIVVRIAAWVARPFLKAWDKNNSEVDHMLCNSHFIAEQIQRLYGRHAEVVYPFCDFERFQIAREPADHYLMVGAFAPNKRVELAIHACNRLKKRLRIMGSGQEEKKLKKMAGPTIEFLGVCSNAEIANELSHCRAFLFPGIEDFGITPLEAMAAGSPVIAFRGGGVQETVTEQTGLFFDKPTPESLMNAIVKFEASAGFDEFEIRDRARQFSKAEFQRQLLIQVGF